MNFKIFKNKGLFLSILSAGCIHTAIVPSSYSHAEPMLDEAAMDLSANPCNDFEQYVCGNWIKNTTIPEDKSRIMKSFSSVEKENLKINRELLETFASGQNLDYTPTAKKLGDFYAGCMDTTSIAKTTHTFLAREFSVINTLTKQNFANIVGELQNKGVEVFMRFSPEQDFHESSQMIATLDQGGLGLPGRDYYFENDHATLREKYIVHIARMFELSGASHEAALQNAQAVMKFETALAQNALRPVDRRDPQRIYHITALTELQASTPNINWNTLLEKMKSPKFDKLNVAVPEFFTNLNALLSNTPIDEIKNYLRWSVLDTYSMDLGGAFAQERFEFFQKTLQGQNAMTPRWEYCVEQTDNSLADALGRAFVVKTFGAEGKEKALQILNSIQNVFEQNLSTMEWMDAETSQYAIAKLNAIMKKIGYADTWRDLSELKISRNHMQNVKTAAKFSHKWELSKIGKPVDRTEWQMTPDTVNAYYNPSNNEIVFPAGILQSPFFNLNAPLAANYGAFGAVIGHEITHGFDDEGRQFDADGNFRQWWTPTVENRFDTKTQCLVDQYSQYTVADGVHLNGKLTLGENIADLGGLKIALGALKASFPKDLSAQDRLSEQKKFFIAFGQMWCGKSTPESAKMRASTDPHANHKYRINGVLTNTPEFTEVFQCPLGAPLAPINRCEIW